MKLNPKFNAGDIVTLRTWDEAVRIFGVNAGNHLRTIPQTQSEYENKFINYNEPRRFVVIGGNSYATIQEQLSDGNFITCKKMLLMDLLTERRVLAMNYELISENDSNSEIGDLRLQRNQLYKLKQKLEKLDKTMKKNPKMAQVAIENWLKEETENHLNIVNRIAYIETGRFPE